MEQTQQVQRVGWTILLACVVITPAAIRDIVTYWL
jgi:hypothetical protein